MGFTVLNMLLWLLTVLPLTEQELVGIRMEPIVTAECGQQVTLDCTMSSSSPDKVTIHRMVWFFNQNSLCSVDSTGNVTLHPSHTQRDFNCTYNHGKLSLVLKNMNPLESGHSRPYMCKLQSNNGASNQRTTVELQECAGKVEGVWTSAGPVCTFYNVCPDGEVDWFHGDQDLSHGTNTSKRVDENGWLIIHSHLRGKTSNVPYNCSLRGIKSGRYIASTLVKTKHPPTTGSVAQTRNNAAGLRELSMTFLCILLSLVAALK